MNWSQLAGHLWRLAGLLMLGALVLAPFDYGATSWGSERVLSSLLYLAVGLGAVSLGLRQSGPDLQWVDFAVLYLLLTGWWMTFNAHSLYDPDSRSLAFLQEAFPSAPGSINRLGSWPGMIRMTALLGAFVLMRSLANDPVWRRHALALMAATGFAVALVGIMLKIGGFPLMQLVWTTKQFSPTEFAFFHYHGNAGAFLNLTLPIAFALAVIQAQRSRRWMLFWIVAVLVILLAAQLNFSKAGLAIAVLLLLLLGSRAWTQAPAPWRRRGLIFGTALAITLVLLTISLESFLTYPTAWQKWSLLYHDRQEAIYDRIEVHRMALRMARDGGWWGFGPETFEAALVPYQDAAGHPNGRWYYAHQDYLQAVVEWGWGGALAWAFIILGGFWRAVRDFVFPPPSLPDDDQWLRYATLLALAGVLIHAGFDFPLEIDSIRLYVLTFLALAWSKAP